MAPTRTKLATCDEESVPLVAPLVAEQKHAAHRSYAKVIAGGALATLGAFACFANPRPTVNLNAAGARLGGASSGEFTLHTGCSPLNKLSYGFSGAGTVGARMVSKSMSNDFRFEQAVEMKEVSCGNYAISDFSLEEGEEFGFYLYPIGDTSDETTVLDDGCLHEGDARCPAFASPAALVGGECAVKYTDPGSDDVFYNRVYDGSTTAYTWGSCEATCAVGQPDGCPSTATQSPQPSSGEDEWRDSSGLPDWDIFLVGDDYDSISNKWKDEQSGYECTLGSTTTYDDTEKSFHFDYSQSSLITCPYDISPSSHSDLTIEIIFKLDDDYNSGSTKAWIVGHDNGGYDRSLILSDDRYGGVGSGIGGKYTSGITSPSVGIWHHGIATFRQGVSGESFVAIDGVLGSKVTANNGNGKSEFTIGGLANYANHGIKGFVKGVRVFPVSFNDTLAELAWEEAKGFIDELNTGEATLSPSPSPPPPPLEEQCPISTSTADAGYADAYRGWYDASGCGICQDYCRWVGNSGAGGDPSKKTTHGTSWWSCRAAKGTAAYTGKTEYGSTFGFAKCSGQGATPPQPSLEEQCPISTSTADAGYVDAYRGWYDASGCGICQDYCRWVGNSGPGGDPSKKTTHGSSWWSCRAAKGTAPYTGKTEYGSTFGFAKCSGQGATPP